MNLSEGIFFGIARLKEAGNDRFVVSELVVYWDYLVIIFGQELIRIVSKAGILEICLI